MRDQPKLYERCRGKWHGLLPSLGVDSKLLDGKHHPCPLCDGKDRWRYTDLNGDGRYICNQCGRGHGMDLVMAINGWDFAHAAKEIEALLGDVPARPVKKAAADDPAARAAMNKLWDTANQIVPGDFVDRYFASRGIKFDRYPPCLRKHESIKHEDEDGKASWHPAFLAKIEGPDGKPVNVHRNYLTLDGKKAAVEPQRKAMRGGIPKGSAIRLMEPGPVLGIAEGIETALSASDLFRVPVWSVINTTIMEGWIAPEGVHQVIIFGDNDPKFGGHKAAWSLAHRLAVERKVAVRVEIPEDHGEDWNDVLLKKRAAS